MKLSIKGNGTKVKDRVKEYNYGKMETVMRVLGKMIKFMVMDGLLSNNILMKAKLLMTKQKDLVHIIYQMVQNILGNIKTIEKTVKVSIFGLMEKHTKENIKTSLKMDQEFWNRMETFIMVIGKKGNNMVKERYVKKVNK